MYLQALNTGLIVLDSSVEFISVDYIGLRKKTDQIGSGLAQTTNSSAI